MADADSLHDMSSDLDVDQSAVDADGEDDEISEQNSEAAARKKSKKKKRKQKDIERSSGDSDSQVLTDEQEYRIHLVEGKCDQSQSGVEADSEGQDSRDKVSSDSISKDTAVMKDNPTEDTKHQSIVAGLQKIQWAMELLSMPQGAPKSLEEANKKRYQFWETQPVPKLSDKIDENVNEAIEADKELDDIRGDCYSLPDGFQWDTLDINKSEILKELYTLLNENYVEDDDNMFRFDYSPDFLLWALQPPGWVSNWHCGVRVTKNNKLVGFISAVPAHIKIYDKKKHMVEINFLCVHKKLRSKRVAPVLIREITRRVHQHGLFQAVYTAGVVLPKPIACSRYWHRSLNPRKLIEVKFSHLGRNMTMQRTLKFYKLPDFPRTTGFRAFRQKDVVDSYHLLREYLHKFDLAPIFTEDEFRHWFIPRNGIIDSFVVENNGKITDFVSFYTLPSTVMHHPVHKTLKAAYSFYIVGTKTPWPDLMQDALIVAKNMGFDVFNALDLMDNREFLKKLKFGIGDGNLQYYLYNWRCPSMEAHRVGLVLQ